eukprot:2300371-Amphidinium_carterae.1
MGSKDELGPLRVLVSLTQRRMSGSTLQQRTVDNHYNFQLDYIAKYHLLFFKSSTTSTLPYESTCSPLGGLNHVNVQPTRLAYLPQPQPQPTTTTTRFTIHVDS